MNDLLKEASKQTILEAISFLWLGGRGKVRKSLKTYYRPLHGTFMDYTTENPDVSSPCEVLPPDYQAFLDGKHVSKGGFTPELMAKLRPWWEKQDEDKEWIKKTEKELF